MSHIDYIKVLPTGIVIIPEYLGNPKKKNYLDPNTFDLQTVSSAVQGELSKHSINRIKKAMHLLIAISPTKTFISPKTLKKHTFRISFITLTLSAKQGIHTDEKIKRELLNHWLIVAKRKFGLTSYIWKAETQKNGNIHFHITTNIFIHYQDLRDSWNNIQKKLGYIDLFNEKHSHINPNSTDIRSVKSIKNIGAYVAKYLSKNDDKRRLVKGKIWSCSKNLLIKNDSWHPLYDNDLNSFNDLMIIHGHKLYESDFFKFLPLSESELYCDLPEPFRTTYFDYLQKVKNN